MLIPDIIGHAERLRKTDVGLSNYATVLNDAFVIIRELAENVIALQIRIENLEGDRDAKR
jgi:hypothetical protein